MDLPSEAWQRPLLPRRPPAASSLAPLRPVMKKIKRTSFPDWEEGRSAKRTSKTPLMKEIPETSRLSSSQRVQEAQKRWEEERRQQPDQQPDQQQEQPAAIEAPAPVEDDSGSEYITSDSPESDEEAESDSEAMPKITRATHRQSQPAISTGLESDSSIHRQRLQEGMVKPWRSSADPSFRHRDSSSFSRPAPTRHRSSTHNDSPQASTMIAPTAAVRSDVLPPQIREDRTVVSIEPNTDGDSEGPTAYRYHLSPNELEAKIRRDSANELLGKDSSDAQAGTGFKRSQNNVGPNGELYTTQDGRSYSTLVIPQTHLQIHIEVTEPEKITNLHLVPDGSKSNTSTLPIPTNYELHTSNQYPYVCPVRTCRRLGTSISSLIGHFSAAHNRTKFNDNLDGSISIVGSYTKGQGLTSPGIIVSRGPPPPGTAPPVTPQASHSAKRHATNEKLSDPVYYDPKLPSPPVTHSPVTVPPSIPASLSVPTWHDVPVRHDLPARHSSNLTEPVKYLLGLLNTAQEPWQRLDIVHLSRYPRKRDLPPAWIAFHSKGFICPSIYAYSLAYIVGDEVTVQAEKCTAPLKSTARLSDRCIRLPSDLPDSVCEEFSKIKTCVGCRYYSFIQRRRSACSWSRDGWPRDNNRESTSEAGTDGADLERVRVSKESTDGDSPAPEAPKHGLRRSLNSRTGLNKQASSGLRYSNTFSETSAPQPNTTQFEMEDWEFAPGRVLNNQQPAQNVAFSNSYLTSREPVTVSDDISFNVSVLSSGSTVHFSTETSKLRTCSVAAGKVKVKIGPTEFKIGPHGMFKVMPGESCVVENRHYVDAYIHCTTVDNYELT